MPSSPSSGPSSSGSSGSSSNSNSTSPSNSGATGSASNSSANEDRVITYNPNSRNININNSGSGTTTVRADTNAPLDNSRPAVSPVNNMPKQSPGLHINGENINMEGAAIGDNQNSSYSRGPELNPNSTEANPASQRSRPNASNIPTYQPRPQSSPIPIYSPSNYRAGSNNISPVSGVINGAQMGGGNNAVKLLGNNNLDNSELNPSAASLNNVRSITQPRNSYTSSSSGGRAGNADNDDIKVKLATALASLSGFFLTAGVVFIILVVLIGFSSSILIFLSDATCGLVDKANYFVSNDLKNFCTEYRKIKNGCLTPKSQSELGVNKTKDLACIGKALDDKSDSVELYGIKGTTKAKKDVIKEIMKVGKDNSIPDNIIRITIALYPIQSLTNAWKEAGTGGCYGIAQLCANTNYNDAVDGLNITSVGDYQKDPALQMKSIQNLYKKRQTQLKTAPDCFKDKFKGKSEVYKFFYVFDEVKCTGEITQGPLATTIGEQTFRGIGVDRVEFADYLDKNYQTTDCNEFKSKLASNFTDNIKLSYRPYQEPNRVIQESKNNINDFVGSGIIPAAKAQFKIIGNDQCVELKKYSKFLESAASKYANNLLPISPQILGAILSRESHVGLLIGGCAGYGDYGNGHGLGQADPSGVSGLTGRNSAVGLKIQADLSSYNALATDGPKINKKYGPDTFIWSECQDGINFMANHLVGKQLSAHNGIIAKMKRANMNVDADDKGFKDFKAKKAYLQFVINAYNAGQGGIMRESCSIDTNGVVYDGCTTGRDYGTDVYARAIEVAKCIGGGSTLEQILAFVGGLGINLDCETAASTSFSTADGDFPLVTQPGVIIRWTQPFPAYFTSGAAHNGIDIGPEPTNPEKTKVVAIQNGTITSDSTTESTSCETPDPSSCGKKTQRVLSLSDDSNKNRTFTFVHLDTSPAKKYFTKGAKVAKGDVIGQIDNFKFIHLHFTVKINGIAVQPADHLPALKGKEANPAGTTDKNTVPISATVKLP